MRMLSNVMLYLLRKQCALSNIYFLERKLVVEVMIHLARQRRRRERERVGKHIIELHEYSIFFSSSSTVVLWIFDIVTNP